MWRCASAGRRGLVLLAAVVLALVAAAPVTAAVTGDQQVVIDNPGAQPSRLLMGRGTDDFGRTDFQTAISYNWAFDPQLDWHPDDPAQESAMLVLESWWTGGMELNVDQMNNGLRRRPFGLRGHYDGSYAVLDVGGRAYDADAGGVGLAGGANPDRGQFRIYERRNATSDETVFGIVRPDRTYSTSWRGGSKPRLNLALAGQNAVGFGSYGVFKFLGAWPAAEPVLNFQGSGSDAVLMRTLPAGSDAQARHRVRGDGRQEWGSGSDVPDVDLTRAASQLLRTSGQFRAARGVGTRVVTKKPTDADFPNAVDGLMVVDKSTGRLWIRVNATWKFADYS
jgi:hypothetical protein